MRLREYRRGEARLMTGPAIVEGRFVLWEPGTCGCRKLGHVADLRVWVVLSTDWVLVQAGSRCAS